MITLFPSFAHPGEYILLVLRVSHLPDSLQPWSLVGPAMAASNSWILSLWMVMKLVGVMGTAQKKSMFIGRKGRTLRPLKAPRCQKVAGIWNPSSEEKHSNVLENSNSSCISLRCQVSHPALVPTLVDRVRHQAGGSATSTNESTTGCDQGGRI